MFSLFKKIKESQREKKQKKRLQWFFIVGLLIALASGYLLYSTPILTPRATQLLPANDLLSFVQLSSHTCQKNTEKTPQLCKKYNELFTTLTTFSAEEISPFADHVAVAGFKSSFDNTLLPVKMFRITSMREANSFLIKKYGETTEKERQKTNIETFFLGEGTGYAFFHKGWLFLAPQDFSPLVDAVTKGDAFSADSLPLFSFPSFSGAETFGFVKTSYISTALSPQYRPLAGFFPEVLFALHTNGKKVELSLDAPARSFSQTDSSASSKHNLFESLPQENLIALGGVHNLRAEVEQVLKYFEQTDPAFAIAVRGELQGFVEDIFGSSLSLENDVLPLAEGGSTLALYSTENGTESLFVVDTEDAEFLETKREKMLSSAEEVMAQLVPRIITHVLDDETRIQEVVACDDCTGTLIEEMNGVSFTTITATNEEEEKKMLSLAVEESVFGFSKNKTLLSEFFMNRKNGGNPLSILDGIGDLSAQEVFVVYPQKLKTITQEYTEYIADFAVLAATYGKKEKYWNLTLRAEVE